MIKQLVLMVAVVTIAIGCATNPVTGKRELSLVSEDWELKVGQQQYAPARQSQGGDYNADPQVQAYVSEVGKRLAAASDRKLPYEFKVLNSGVPNAWALPGGKISINRGLLVEMQSEAELAAVLGHEIVHAAARHGAQGMSRGVLLQGGVMAATIATAGKDYSNLAQLGASVGAQLISTRYGRDAERESDLYGMRYMAKAGYDPQGAVDLQATFVKLSEGRRQDFISGLFASHPPSQERLNNNRKLAASLPKGGTVGRERYKKMMARLLAKQPAYGAYEKGKKALADGNVAAARKLARQAIKMEPREGHFHSFLGDIEQTSGRLTTARKSYENAIKANGGFFYYHLQHGLTSEKLRDYASAKRSLARSNQLLPSADANNALGNIAQLNGQSQAAIALFSKAAGNNSVAGKAARSSLIKLDFPRNPGKYIVARHQLSKNGTITVQVRNTTHRTARKIALKVVYPDVAGRLREATSVLRGSIAAGKAEMVQLPYKINAQLARTVRTTVVRADLIN